MNNEPLLQIKIFIPAYNELPLKKAQEWADRYYSQARHTSGQRRNAIRTQKDFMEKMAKPILETTKGFISPDFISRSGLTAENIANKMKDKLLDKRTADKYLKGLDRAFRKVDGVTAKKIKDKLPLGAADYCLKMTFGAWRLLGPLNPVRSERKQNGGITIESNQLALNASNGVNESGASAITLAEDILAGQQNTLESLRGKDELFTGRAVRLTEPKNQGRFRKELHNQLMRSFKNIYELGYSSRVIKKENDIVNQLISNFLCEKFTPFSTSEESHLNFVLAPESVIPSDSPIIKDIEYKIYRHFLGEKMADHLRSKWIETVRVAPVDPELYIDNPDNSAYFDMYLDIQISGR